MSLSDAIREQIKAKKVSIRSIHLKTGLERSTVRRFITTGAGNIATLDAIAELLGASVAFPAAEKPAKKNKPGK